MKITDYDKLAAKTDHENYDLISSSIFRNQKEAVAFFKDALRLGIRGDMLKKVLIYGLDPNSEDYKNKLKKHMDALELIESGLIDQEIVSSDKFARLYHYYLGLNTESAETISALLNWVLKIEDLDTVNLGEEHGDFFWYLSRANSVLKQNMIDQMRNNILKLIKRYGEKFSSHAALVRDISGERVILESRPGVLSKLRAFGLSLINSNRQED